MSVLTYITYKPVSAPAERVPVKQVHTNVAGTWQDCKQVWTNVGGTWQLVFERLNITDRTIADNVAQPGSAEARIRLNTDGTLDTYLANGGGYSTVSNEWLQLSRTGAGSDWRVRATLNSGTLTSGTTGSFLALSTAREWTVSRSVTAGGSEAVITLDLYDGDALYATALASAQITLQAVVTP